MASFQRQYLSFLALLLFLLFPQSAKAQTNTGFLGNDSARKEEDLYLPQESGLVKFYSGLVFNTERDRIYARIPSLKSVPANISAQRLDIIGNTILSDDLLQSFVLSVANDGQLDRFALKKLVGKINRTYSYRGYVTSGVWIEPKVGKDGTLVIRITEGKISELKFTGLNKLNDQYLRRRLFKNGDRIFNLKELTKELQLLKINSLIDDLSAKVAATKNPAQHILTVEVKEADPFYLELSLDNLGFPNSGSLRRQLKVNHDNLLGFGDRLNAGYTNTDGRDILDTFYILPINASNGELGFSYSFGEIEIVELPLRPLDLDLKFSGLQLSLRQPLYQTPKQEFALGLAVSRVSTETTLTDLPFPIRGADEDGELNVSAISFYQDYTKRGEKDRFDLRSELRLGVDLFDATNNDESPDTSFFLRRGQGSYRRKFSDKLTLSLTSLFQLSDRELVFLEQTASKLFTVGREEEAFILRGYRRGSLQADNGVFASGEVQFDFLAIDRLDSTLQLIPFIDFGTAWNNDDIELDQATLISAGLGLRLLVNDNFRARVDWGIPLIERDFDGGSLQEDGITFNLEYRPL